MLIDNKLDSGEPLKLICDKQDLGKRIKLIREDQDLTQAWVAEKAQVELKTYGQIERGVSFPSFQTFVGICVALNVSPNEILIIDYDSYDVDEEKFRANLRNKKYMEMFISKLIGSSK